MTQYTDLNPFNHGATTIRYEEIKALPLAIQDEALRRVITILGNHYLRNNTAWSFDLPKQVTTLREGAIFSF